MTRADISRIQGDRIISIMVLAWTTFPLHRHAVSVTPLNARRLGLFPWRRRGFIAIWIWRSKGGPGSTP
jgi:hypothetical protein